MDSDSDDGSVSSNNTELEKNFNTYIPDMTSEDALVARSVLAFLLEPSSSVYSFAYNTTASFLVILHVSAYVINALPSTISIIYATFL